MLFSPRRAAVGTLGASAIALAALFGSAGIASAHHGFGGPGPFAPHHGHGHEFGPGWGRDWSRGNDRGPYRIGDGHLIREWCMAHPNGPLCSML
jgi:hypothetical protein